jgi:TRAP-type C4-dicarboxylate transport system permease small subunit
MDSSKESGPPPDPTEKRWRPLHLLVAVFIGLMMLVGTVDVTLRYVFDAPLSWGIPIIGLFLGLTIFSGMIIVSSEDEHITVGLLDRWIVGRGRKVQMIAVYIVSIGSLLFIAERMLTLSTRHYKNQNFHEMIDIVNWPFSLIFGVLAAISGLLVVRNLIRVLRKNVDDVETPETPNV